jgi:hypothetical protein
MNFQILSKVYKEMTDLYNRLSQLIPGCLYLTYSTVQSTILGNTVTGCATDQNILLWIAISLFSILCFGSSIIADANVQYIPPMTQWLVDHPKLKAVLPPAGVHAMFATLVFLTIVIFNPPTFSCLFSTMVSSTLVKSLPILGGSFLLASYGMMFNIPT